MPVALPVHPRQQHRHYHAHNPGCRTPECDRRVWKWWARHHPASVSSTADTSWQYEGEATYYSPGECDSTGGGFTAADGTHVYFGMVANSVLPLGTNIEVSPPIMGQSRFTVHDRFGSQQPVGRLDVWLPCGESIPNPYERFRTVGIG